MQKYAAKNFTGYELHEFCDDGYTGTNFERPGMQDMLESVRNGDIHCEDLTFPDKSLLYKS